MKGEEAKLIEVSKQVSKGEYLRRGQIITLDLYTIIWPFTEMRKIEKNVFSLE